MTLRTEHMSRNDALRAARLRKGWRTIEAAAMAMTELGQQLLDDRQFTLSARTWRCWEGDRPGWPAEETAIVIHDAFGLWPEDLGFTTPPGWIRPEHHEEEQVRRQSFVSVTAAALVAGPVAPQHVDPALIGYFQQQLEGHYRADMLLGPHDLIGTVSAQYQLIDKLVRSAKGETRRGLLRVGAAYAALVGWLYQDAGDMDGAAFWRGVTQEIATRSRDPHLIAYSLVNQAQVRTDLGDGHAVVDLCEAALDEANRLVPKVRIMAMQQQAHGASLAGERGLVDQLIDQADRLLPRVDDDLPWGNACRRTPATSKYSGPPATDVSDSAPRRVPCGRRSSILSRRPPAVTAGCTWPGRRQLRRLPGNRIRRWRSPGARRRSRWRPARPGCGWSWSPWNGRCGRGRMPRSAGILRRSWGP